MSLSTDRRELNHISDKLKILAVVKNYLLGKVMFIKGIHPNVEVKIINIQDPGQLEILVDAGEENLGDYEDLKLFRILGRYIELKCRFVGVNPENGKQIITIAYASIASRQRQHMRIPIQGEEASITNIRTSKHTIDASLYKIPTSVKVNFGLLEQTLRPTADTVQVDIYSKRGTIFDEIRKTGKILLLNDSQKLESYDPAGENYLDYAAYLGLDLPKKIIDYRRNEIKSELIYPIIYYAMDNEQIPLGYIHMQSKVRHFDETAVEDLKNHTTDLIDKIRDSNTVLIKEKQQVLNLSRGGLKVKITNNDLKEYLIKQRGFSFDLVFRMQAPITLFSAIRSAARTLDGNLLLGLQIVGNSSRPNEMKRYLDNIAMFEQKVKERIVEKRKTLERKKLT